ncbi:MAG: hypothetical protein WCK46_03210 [Candidatus Adlerbacteria bacterium]
MPEQKTNLLAIVSAIVGICIIAGTSYYLWQRITKVQTPTDTVQTPIQPGNTTSFEPLSQQSIQQPANDIKVEAIATLDQSSLISDSATPTITGTYLKTTGLEIIIAKGNLPQTAPLIEPVPGEVWSDRSDHGGGIVLSGDSSGAFRSTVTTLLPDGTYTVGVYFDSVYYPQTEENLARDLRTLLTQGTLVVHSER